MSTNAHSEARGITRISRACNFIPPSGVCMNLSKNARPQPASDPSKKIPAAFIEELGKLIGSFLADRERKRQTHGDAQDVFSVNQEQPSNQSGPEE